MRTFFFSIFICCNFFFNNAYSQIENAATITIKADKNPISIKLNGELYENLLPGKSISFDANEGEKMHIVLEDNEGNRYVKIITPTRADRGKQFLVKFPVADNTKIASEATTTKELKTPEKTVAVSKDNGQVARLAGTVVKEANKPKAADEVVSMEPEINSLRFKAQKDGASLAEKLEKIFDGKINRDDKEVTTAYEEASLTLLNIRKTLRDNAGNRGNNAGSGLVKTTSFKTLADTVSLSKSITNYEAVRDGKKPCSKNLLIAFNKNRAYDLRFFITKKNVADTLIDEKPILIYALQQGCNASVIKYLIDISGGKDEFINYDKFSFMPPNEKIYMCPLTLACINGDPGVVNLLIDAKARFYPANLDANKAKAQRKFLWQQFRSNKEIYSIITKRVPEFSDPFNNAMAAIDTIVKDMVLVEGGTFKMGCQGDRADCGRAWPQIETTIPSFYISKFELTQLHWEDIMENNPTNNPGCKTCPADNVSWDDVQVFLEKLNQLSGKKFRLPSEKEWEFAAKGGTLSKKFKYSGGNTLDSVSWFKSNAESVQPVGTKMPNELGLYDMSGNVFEWCSSYFTETLEIYKTLPEGASKGIERVLRGGSWKEGEFFSQPVRRHKEQPATISPEYGFRLVLDK